VSGKIHCPTSRAAFLALILGLTESEHVEVIAHHRCGAVKETSKATMVCRTTVKNNVVLLFVKGRNSASVLVVTQNANEVIKAATDLAHDNGIEVAHDNGNQVAKEPTLDDVSVAA
jgi:predicted nucleotidyltransferase